MDFFEFETAASVAVYVLCGGFAMWTLVNTIDAVLSIRRAHRERG
mgnify:CR=1 FL=1